MDSPSAEQTDGLTALESGRAQLRALAARAVTTADRMITRLPQNENAQTIIRTRLKTYGGRLLDTLETLPLPKTHTDGECA